MTKNLAAASGADAVKKYLKQNGFTPRDLAVYYGFTPETVHQYLNKPNERAARRFILQLIHDLRITNH